MNSPISLSFSYERCSYSFPWPCTGLSLVNVSPSYKGDPNWTMLQPQPHKFWLKGKYHLHWLTGNTSPNANQKSIGFPCHKDTFLTYSHLAATRTLKAFSTNLIYICFTLPHIIQCSMLFLPRCRNWNFPLLSCMKFISASFSIVLVSLWMTAQPYGVSSAPSSLQSSANLLSVPSCHLPHLINEGVEQHLHWYCPLWYCLQLAQAKKTLWILAFSIFFVIRYPI